MSEQCSGCGYIHPGPSGDHCPVLKTRKRMESEKGRHIAKFTKKLTEYLDDQDQQACDEIIKRLSKVLKFSLKEIFDE